MEEPSDASLDELNKELEVARAEQKLAFSRLNEARNNPKVSREETQKRRAIYNQAQSKAAGIEAIIDKRRLDELRGAQHHELNLSEEISQEIEQLGDTRVALDRSISEGEQTLDAILDERRGLAEDKSGSINKSLLTFAGAIIGLGITAYISDSTAICRPDISLAILLASISLIIGAMHPLVAYINHRAPGTPEGESEKDALDGASADFRNARSKVQSSQEVILFLQAGSWAVATFFLLKGII